MLPPTDPGWRSDPLIVDLLSRCSFPAPRTPVVCAVSGGADSLTLLVLAVAAGCHPEAVHVDHRLRPGSASEAVRVGEVAEALDVPWRSVAVEVEAGSDLENRARQARYAALPEGVLTGHTAEDQAETVILQLLRGAGPAGASGIRPGPNRPILGLRRAETETLCAGLGLSPVVDPSNTDPRFRRNRVRHEVLPVLADVGDRDPVPLLVRHADLCRAANDHLVATAGGIDPTDARALATAPPALAAEAVRRWLRPHIHGYPPDQAAVERVLEVARLERRACEVAGGVRVARRAGRLEVELRSPS
ncbi:MAG: tRNA lysidine(34) synthetase TilS [Actinomycetia bacterium]|nr:tRNA lysidine(34) synthetase TilS [Actinomycetes bacterium]